MGPRNPVVDDLWLPEHDTAQTVQVGHSPLPFEESDCNLHVRIVDAPIDDSAPTRLLLAAKDPDALDPSGLITAAPPDSSSWVFLLCLLAISLASAVAGVLLSG